jgi:hypothetical protein
MSRSRKLLVLACLGAGLVIPRTPSSASDTGATIATAGTLRHVATTGADTGSCTSPASPCLTVNYAVSQAIAGDTVQVAAGTYPEMVNVDRSLTFVGANVGKSAGTAAVTRTAETTVKGFRSPANKPGWPYPSTDQEYSTTIDGFTIDPQGDASLLSASTHHLVALFGGPDVKVQNNIFNGGPYDAACGYTCTTMTDSALNVQSGTFAVTGNLFTNFRSPIDISQHDAAHPIVSGTLSANLFTHITSRAVWLYDDAAPGAWPGVTVSNNTFDAIGWNNPDWGPAAVVITTGGNHLTGNTITNFSSGVFAQVCDGSNPGTADNVYDGNHFLTNRSGIQYYVVGTGCATVHAAITDNDFVGNTAWGVRWNGEAPPNDLDATCNWWGAAGGAGSTGADKATANVLTDPWNTASGGPCYGGFDVPTAPTIATAIAGDALATATWTAPSSDGGVAITGYEVTPYAGATALPAHIFTSTATTQVITGLTNGTTYTFKVAAINGVGTGPQSAASNAVTPHRALTGDGTVFVPLTPCRVVDTRSAGGAFADREIRAYEIAGSGPAFAAQGGQAGGCGIPTGASGVEASVSAVSPSGPGFFRSYPADQPMPTATFLNFAAHQDITNTGALALATTGTTDLKARNFGGTSQYVIDVDGYFIDPDLIDDGTVFVPLTPCRVVDTRVTGGAFADREIRAYEIAGSGSAFADQGGKAGGCGIPAEASGVEASITSVSPSASGFFRAYPADQPMPTATFLSKTAHQDITNTGALALATTGTTDLKARNFGGTSQYVIDVQGYFIDPDLIDDGTMFVPLTPCRVVDTRVTGGAFADREIRAYEVAGSGSAFAAQGGKAGGCGIPAEATAVEASVSAVSPSGPGFFRAYPADQPMPTATFLNFAASQDITNTGAIALATTGTTDLKARNFGGTSQYVIDVQGYYAPIPPPPA